MSALLKVTFEHCYIVVGALNVSCVYCILRACIHTVDIYDGDREPMIFHGKTLTSKISLRDVCRAIKKYGFVSSPYPVIISAEIHCGLAQQDMMVEIMLSVFGDALVQAPVDGRPPIHVLPSPEDLKGRILLKAKNLLITRQRPPEPEVLDTSTSSTSDTDFMQEARTEWDKAKKLESETVKGKIDPDAPVQGNGF